MPSYAAWAVILGLFAVLGPCPAARARQSDTPPAPAEAMRLYQAVDGWVRTWRIPSDADAPAATPGLTAVSVTLRHDGAIIGRGVGIAPLVPPDANARANALVNAAAQAMAEAAGRLPIERDALYNENLRAAAARLAISLELAGPMIPIAPAEWADATTELSAGLDGVAVRVGDATGAMFPGAMIVGGMDPARALAAALSKASGDPSLIVKRPADLAKEHGAVFYRFRAAHLAQPRAGEPPVFLHRGGRVIEKSELTEAELRRWGDGLAQNLLARRWPGAEKYGLQGTYDPVKGTYETRFAPPADQALAIIALDYYTSVLRHQAGESDVITQGMALAADLATVEEGEIAPWDDLAAAALFLPIASGSSMGERLRNDGSDVFGESAARCRAAVDRAFNESGVFAEDVPAALRPLLVFGVAVSDTTPPDDQEGMAVLAKRLETGVRQIFASTPPGDLVSRMPWLGHIALMSAAAGALPGADTPALPSAVALRQMRTMVWDHQLQAPPLTFDQRDLAGGILFTASRNPAPSWQSARPLAFIATMLGDQRLTDPPEVNAEIVRLLASLRFLRQLSAGPAEGHMYADPARAMWGVRASLWDQSQPLDATAMTLLTVCETLKSLESLRARAPK